MRDRMGRLILVALVGALLTGFLTPGGADALPRKGGPAIIDASWDEAAGILSMIFNEGVTAASTDPADFAFSDTNVVIATLGDDDGDRELTVTAFSDTTPVAGDQIYMSWIEVLLHANGIQSNEATPITINSGPVILSATLATSLNDDPTDDVLTVVFNEAASNVDSTDFVFSANVFTESLVVAGAGATYTISNFYWNAPNAAERDSALQLLPYITTIALAASSDIENANGDTATSTIRHRIVNGEGAYILDAAYDSLSTPGLGDDTLYIVYNMPVRDSLSGSNAVSIDVADFTIGGTGTMDLTGATPDLSLPVERPWMPWLVKFTNPATGAAAGDNIAHSGAGVMQNSMWDTNTETATHAVSLGPIIVGALYKDSLFYGGRDSVIVRFNQQVTGATVQDGAFNIRGFDPNGASNWVGSGRRFARRVNNNSWAEGAAIAINPGAGTPIEGSASGEVATSAIWHPVRDLNAAKQTDVIQVRTDLIREFSWPGDSSIVRIAWREASGTDRFHYYKLFTRIGDAVSDTFVNENWANGIPVYNPTSGLDNPIIAYLNITPDSLVSNGDIIEDGDVIHVGIVGADWNGNYGVINFSGYRQSIALQQTFVAGHINPLRDWIPSGDPTFAQDDNVIHVIGHWNMAGTANDSVYADSGCVEANATVVIYADAAATDTLAVANANGAGGWGAVDIGFDNGDANGWIYLVGYDGWGNATDTLAIVNDVWSTMVGSMSDPYNPLKIYANADSIVVLLDFSGSSGDTTYTPTVYDGFVNYLNLASSRGRMWADFSNIDTFAGNDSIPFANWLTDQVDNDGDWDTTAAGGDTYQPFANQKNYPEPFVDENGNGSFDLGEEFWDLADTAYTNNGGTKVYNAGDGRLDYNDTDELFFKAVLDTIRASTSVTDESGLPKTGFAVIKDLPVIVNILDVNQNMALDTMLVDLDQVAPEVCYISRIEQQQSLLDLDEEYNIREPGLNIYPIGEFIDLTFETPSDSLVDYVVLQFNDGVNGWRDLVLDPPGDHAGDGGYPGIDGVDDDNDGAADSMDAEVLAAFTSPTSDGVDNNNDGQVDNDADTLYLHYWHWDDDEDGMMDGSTIGTLTSDGLSRGGTGVDYLPHLLDVANFRDLTGDTLKGLGKNPNGAYGVETSAADSAFHYFFQNGFNLNMRLASNVWGLPDSITFEMRAVAYDWVGQSIGPKVGYNADSVDVGHWYMAPAYTGGIYYAAGNRTGNFNPDNSASEKFRLNLEAPNAAIDSAAFAANDVKAAAGIQVFDTFDSTWTIPPVNATYEMTAMADADVDSVVFQVWNATTEMWDYAGSDGSAPYVYLFTAPLQINDPVDNTTDFYFRTKAKDAFGNWEMPDDTLLSTYELMFTVVDGAIPLTNISSCEVVGGNIDTDLSNGCQVPKDSIVIFRIDTGDFDDRDGDPSYFDMPFVRFEYRKVIQGKATGEWMLMGSVTGTIDEGDTLADLYPPVAVTWNTADTSIVEGDYEIRAWSEDVEGNNNKKTTFIFTATVIETPLRAYIDPPTRINDSTYALYAKVWIHDIEVDHVDFQYYYDVDENGMPDDTGEDWISISIDDNDDTLSMDPGGDVILREGVGTLRILDSLNTIGANLHRNFLSAHGYVDYDGDGYSPRDPVYLDNGNGVVGGGDTAIIGSGSTGDVITPFDAIEFYADADGVTGLSSGDWIFRQNMGGFLMDSAVDSLQLWSAMWNVAGLGSQYLVRAVATDELGNTDTSSAAVEIPYEVLGLDTEAPVAIISALALGHGGKVYNTPNIDENVIVAGDNAFIKIWGSSAADDLASIKFQYSVQGGSTWVDIDVNDDNDFFVDIDGDVGFTTGDAILVDVYDDDTTFTVTATDILLDLGLAPDQTAMLGMRMFPLIGEDTVGGSADADGDGQTDEDPMDADDDRAPYCVYLDIDAMTAMGLFHTDTHVQLRAIATDETGNTDAAPEFVSIYIQENVPPETDVIYAISNGDTIDVLPDVGGGSIAQLTAADTLFELFVTAEDTTTIDSVYLYYRMHNCYPNSSIFTNPWMRADVPADPIYPYNFAWDISAFMDGFYEFWLAGKDEELNETPPYEHPYQFGRLTTEAVIDTAARPLAKAEADDHYTDTVLDEVTRASELWIRAELTDSPNAMDPTYASVKFYYANRVLSELLTVQNFYPYISDAVAAGTMLGDETTYPYNVEVVIDTGAADVVCTYHTNAAFEALASPTKYDYTIVSGTIVKFGAYLASTDAAYVSYNFGSWAEISDDDDDVDENGYFTTAWDPQNPVPNPASEYTDAYDLIAVVTYDVEGDCPTLAESQVSEHKIVLLRRTEGPEVTLHGFFWMCCDAQTQYNYVGNPLTRSNDQHRKSKLCGIEYDVMVLVDSVTADSVKFELDESGTFYDLTHYVEGDTLSLTITMNEEDFLFSDPYAIYGDSIENVQLVDLTGSDTYYTMYDDGAHNDGAANDGWWGVTIDIPVTSSTQQIYYMFDIDMSGDEHILAWDPRNDVSAGADTSKIVIPPDFWHTNLSATLFPNGAHTALAYAWGNDQVGTNATSQQGWNYFIIDCEDPGITDLYVLTPIIGTGDCDEAYLVAVMEDAGEDIEDILELDLIDFQFATDDSKTRWVSLGSATSFDAENGYVYQGPWLSGYYPDDDNIDNDNDGETDEDDERDYTFSLRVVARDDTWNVTIMEGGTIRIDRSPPAIILTAPDQGTVVAWGDTITICAMPATGEDAVGLDYYKFFFSDSAGQPKVIDPTPLDNSDDPIVPADGENEVCIKFATNWLSLEEDQYIQFWAMAVDSACNESDTEGPIVAAVNDTTGPSACVLAFIDCDTVSVADAHLAVSGDDVQVLGKLIPNRIDAISIIEFWVQPEGGSPVLVNVGQYTVFDANGLFTLSWNADLFADPGQTRNVKVWFVARDPDNNPDPTPLKADVTIDRVNPAVNYSLVDFVNTELYWDDDDDPSGAPDNTPVIVPDPVTGDVTFQVYTSHSDVKSMVVQYRKADDAWINLGNWGGFEGISLDFEPQHTMSQGGTTYYYWWYNVDADDVEEWALEDTIYEWRVLATDYACNTNALDGEVIVAAWDEVDPSCLYFGNDAIADGSIGQVTAGDDVTLNWLGTDNLTDVTHVVFWFVAPWSGDTIVIGSVDAVADSIDCPCNKWSAEIVWTTPEECCLDTDVDVYAWAYDTPGNRGVCSQTIRLEDKLPPRNTRLIDVTDNSCLFPREVTETVLNNQTIWFAGSVTLHAVAAGCDSGVATVYFATVDSEGDTVMIGAVDVDDGIGKSAIGNPVFDDGVYQIDWNTLALDNYGQLLWPDGAYTVIVWAVDLENNVEIPTNSYSFMVDNEAPTVTVTSPGAAGTTVQVERGSEVRLTAVTPTTTEDVVVYWYIRNHQDADCWDGCLDCWTFMDTTNGYYPVDATDENPDYNRPYSWEWASWMNTTPLEVGNKYDIIAIGEDLVCNDTDPCAEWLAGRGVTIEIFDNTAPCATITHLTREICNGGTVEQPENERVRGFYSMRATILAGDTDTEGVRYEYSLDGENWIVADQDLVEYSDFNWFLYNWDSDQIAEGVIYWRAVAWDDVGNVCPNPAVVTLIIDRTAPVVELVAPAYQTCPFEYASNGDHVLPLIVKVPTGVYDDIYRGPSHAGVVFEYKLTVEDTTAWRADSVSNWLFDRGTGYYTATWNIDDADESSGKYDFRATVFDSACNSATYNLATEIVIDVDAPDVNMTRVEIVRWNEDDEETTVVYPINNGVIVDVTQGEPVTLYATVFDDEQDIPGSLETGIDSVFFEVAADSTGTVYHIDLGEPDEGEGIYSARWNTTALGAGDYFVRARAIDECKNVGVSPWTRIHVIDDVAPRAAVICWKPHVLNDINVTTSVTVYATKWCTQDVNEVMFQYRLHGSELGDGGGDGFAGKVEADGWITFGLQRSSVYDDSLWYASMEIGPETNFRIGDTLDLRAVAITLKGTSGDNRDVLYFDQNPPIVTTTIVANRFGRDLATVHPDGEPWLAFNLAELIPDFGSNFHIEVEVSDMIDEDWISIAKPWVLVNAVRARDGWGFEEIVEMDPMNSGSDLDPYLWGGFTANGLLDSIGCGGMVYINAAVVEDSGTVNDDDGYIQTDVIRKTIAVWEVTNGRGTNGWVSIPGHTYPTIKIPSGNGVTGGLLMTTTHTPNFSQDEEQRFFIRPIGQTYQIDLINCAGQGCSEFNGGYWAQVTMGYSDEDLTVRDWLGREVVIDELTGILPAWWDGDKWQNYDIGEVSVDTAANTVSFLVEDFCGNYAWGLVGITGGRQMNIYPWCDGYTSESPTFVGTITDFMAEATLDFPDIEVWIDNQLVASADDDADDRSDLDDNYDDPDLPDIYGFAVGNGFFRMEVVEDEEYSVTFRYHHSTLAADRLSGGKHEIVVIYRNEDEDYYFNLRKEFMVDVVPVQVAWSGGFLNGPCVGGVECYVGGGRRALTVQLTDYEAGVLTQESRINAVLNLIYGTLPEFIGGSAWGWIDTVGTQGLGGLGITFGADTFIPLQDMGLKMDVWLVDNEDDQTDIDEYAERMLIQAGTPAMLTFSPPICPYSDASRCDDSTYYDPSDHLMVTLPLTADLAKYNGREIEVVLYSSKLEHIGFDSNIGQLIGLGGGGGGEDDDEEFTKYIFGPFDCVGNVGSQFVARRFIIDASAPRIVFLSPVMSSIVAPNSEIPVVAVIVDSSGASSAGSGIDMDDLMVSLNGPDGQMFSFFPTTFDPADTASTDDATAEAAQDVVDHVKDWNVEGDKITMTLKGLAKAGTYTLVMEGSDVIGNEFVASHTFNAGSSVLQLTDAYVYPNPVDPEEGAANIRFILGGTRDARVTVKIFDFAGDLVYQMPVFTAAPGLVEFDWSGSTGSGTMVANGGYLAHIAVDDGAGVKTASVKIAVRKN